MLKVLHLYKINTSNTGRSISTATYNESFNTIVQQPTRNIERKTITIYFDIAFSKTADFVLKNKEKY